MLSTESEVVEVESGKVLVRMLSGVYLRGVGGFGGGGGVGKSRGIRMPNRQPDVRIVDQTLEIQAKLYRLSGDYNPLHIDTGALSLRSVPSFTPVRMILVCCDPATPLPS